MEMIVYMVNSAGEVPPEKNISENISPSNDFTDRSAARGIDAAHNCE